MKEELTTKMHSEFTVTPAVETKHKVWAAMKHEKSKAEILKLLKAFGVSKKDYNIYRDSYPSPHPLKKSK